MVVAGITGMHAGIPADQLLAVGLGRAPLELALAVAGRGPLHPVALARELHEHGCIPAALAAYPRLEHAFGLMLASPKRFGPQHRAVGVSQYAGKDDMHLFVVADAGWQGPIAPLSVGADDRPPETRELVARVLKCVDAMTLRDRYLGAAAMPGKGLADAIMCDGLVHFAKNARKTLVADLYQLAMEKATFACALGFLQLSRAPSEWTIRLSARPATASLSAPK